MLEAANKTCAGASSSDGLHDLDLAPDAPRDVRLAGLLAQGGRDLLPQELEDPHLPPGSRLEHPRNVADEQHLGGGELPGEVEGDRVRGEDRGAPGRVEDHVAERDRDRALEEELLEDLRRERREFPFPVLRRGVRGDGAGGDPGVQERPQNVEVELAHAVRRERRSPLAVRPARRGLGEPPGLRRRVSEGPRPVQHDERTLASLPRAGRLLSEPLKDLGPKAFVLPLSGDDAPAELDHLDPLLRRHRPPPRRRGGYLTRPGRPHIRSSASTPMSSRVFFSTW